MRIKMMCWSTRSSVTGLNNPGGVLEVSHKVSLKMLDSETGNGGIEFYVENEIELAKWVSGMEYDLLIEGTSLVSAETVEETRDVPPEGFVIQDKVAVRPGIDLFRWSHWPNKNHWALTSVDNAYLHEGRLHGYRGPRGGGISVCCRPNEYPTDSSAETVKPVINPYEAHCRRMDDIQRAEGVSYEEKLVSVRHSTSMLFDTIEARATEPVCGAAELNDDGIVGVYTDPPQPIESAGGGVQPCEPLRPVEEYDFVTGTWGPPKGVPPLPVPADMNVDADE